MADFQWKARLVAGGDMEDVLAIVTHTCVMLQETDNVLIITVVRTQIDFCLKYECLCVPNKK